MNLNAMTLPELLTHAEQSDDPLVRRLVAELIPFGHVDPEHAKDAEQNAALAAEAAEYDIQTADDLRRTLDRADELREYAEDAADELDDLSRLPPADLGGFYDADDLRRLANLAHDLNRVAGRVGVGED